MPRSLAAALLLLCPGPLAAQGGPESPLLAALARDAAADSAPACSRFWTAVAARGTPLVEPLADDTTHLLATFVFRGAPDTRDVVLVAGPEGVAPFSDPRSHLRRLPGTDVWYVSHHLDPDAEFLYQFSVNPPAFQGPPPGAALRATLTPDTLDPLWYPDRTEPMAASGHGSIARMPKVPDNPWLARGAGTPADSLTPASVASAALGGARQVWTWTTPGPLPAGAHLLILLDGAAYIRRLSAPTILANLFAAQRIGPTLVVFVDNGGARASDYDFSDAFNRFLTDELLPWVRSTYGFTPEPGRTVIGGFSLGGLAAAYAVLRRPDVFGTALAQSGAFWPAGRDAGDRDSDWLARQFDRAPRSGGSFYLEVGSYESAPAGRTTLLASNRRLRDVLRSKGYQVRYAEIPGDHEPVHWRRALPDALIATLGN